MAFAVDDVIFVGKLGPCVHLLPLSISVCDFWDGEPTKIKLKKTSTNLAYLYIIALTQVTKIDLKYLPVPPIIIKPRLGTETREAWLCLSFIFGSRLTR